MKRSKSRRRGGRRRSQGDRDDSPRGRAKALLREGGELLERGDLEAGAEKLMEALSADPAFVEPALTLARVRDEMGDDAIADALVEEAVRRGVVPIDAIKARGQHPQWWDDPATRPYLKALVARGWRRLDRGELDEAAEHFFKAFQLTADDDPIDAGLYAAETLLRASLAAPPGSKAEKLDEALELFARLEENPGVCYGRALVLLQGERRKEATASLWLGIMLNAKVALELVEPEVAVGLERRNLVGDADEADELLGRVSDLWDDPSRALLAQLLGDERFRDELLAWGPLARALDEAADARTETRVIEEIEAFLSADRIEHEVGAFLERLEAADATPPKTKRLPLAGQD